MELGWLLEAPIIRGRVEAPLTSAQMEWFKIASRLRVRKSMLNVAGEGCELGCEGESSYLVQVPFSTRLS